jgi:hypothetical protein
MTMQREITVKPEKTELSRINRLFINWLGWKVVLPLLLILSIYVLIRFVLEIPDPFGMAFAHGELLVFSALVLFEAATEGEHLQESTMLNAVRMSARIAAILLIGGFVATKSDVLFKENLLLMELPKNPNAAGHDLLARKMFAYSWLNCTVALVSVVASIMIFWFTMHLEKKQTLDSLGQKRKPGAVDKLAG